MSFEVSEHRNSKSEQFHPHVLDVLTSSIDISDLKSLIGLRQEETPLCVEDFDLANGGVGKIVADSVFLDLCWRVFKVPYRLGDVGIFTLRENCENGTEIDQYPFSEVRTATCSGRSQQYLECPLALDFLIPLDRPISARVGYVNASTSERMQQCFSSAQQSEVSAEPGEAIAFCLPSQRLVATSGAEATLLRVTFHPSFVRRDRINHRDFKIPSGAPRAATVKALVGVEDFYPLIYQASKPVSI